MKGNKKVTCAPDGTCIAAASNVDSMIRIWRIDEAEIEPSRSSDDQTSNTSGLYISWDGHRGVSTAGKGPMKLWDTVKGSCLMTFNNPNEVQLATISHDYALVASLSFWKSTLQVWSCINGALLMTTEYHQSLSKFPSSIRFSPNGRQIPTVLSQEHMVLWDVETAKKLDEVNLKVTPRSYIINDDGDFVASPGIDLLFISRAEI